MKALLLVIIVTVLTGYISAKTEKKSSQLNAKKTRSLINCEDPNEWETKAVLNTEIKRSGKFSFETFGKYPTKTDYKKFIPIDPQKTYTLTCYMRSLDPKQQASGYMGLYMYDKDKKLIYYNQVKVLEGTESELTVPAAKGSKEIIIKKNDKCLQHKDWVVVFNAKNKYADLPNSDLLRGKEIKTDGDRMKLTLAFPLRKDYKIGTKIRLHSPWGVPFYWGAQGWMPGEWKKFSVTMKGIASHGVPNDQFWKGTKYVKPFFWFANYNRIPKAGAKLLVDDFTFIESK